jgi:hypothetical protein
VLLAALCGLTNVWRKTRGHINGGMVRMASLSLIDLHLQVVSRLALQCILLLIEADPLHVACICLIDA